MLEKLYFGSFIMLLILNSIIAAVYIKKSVKTMTFSGVIIGAIISFIFGTIIYMVALVEDAFKGEKR